MFSIFSPKEGDPHNYFALYRTMFKMLGISFFQGESRSYKVYSMVFLLCTTFTYPLVQFSEIFRFHTDLDILSVTVTYSSLNVMGLAKALILFYHRKAVGKALDVLEEGVFAPNLELGGPQEALWIKECISSINKQCALYMGSVYVTVVFGVSDAIMKRARSDDYHDWTFPVGYFSWFDVTRSPNYEIACFYQVVCVTICFTTLMLSDILISGILAHIATQYKILQNRIKLMVDNAHKRMLQDIPVDSSEVMEVVDPNTIPWEYLRATLKKTVLNHIEIIELAQKFEEQFSYLTLIQFLSTSCTLCFTMYYCSLFSITDFKFIQYMMGAVDMAIQVFFYCYWGNEVALQSWAVADACSDANFVGTDIRFQKGLLLIMQRSQKPLRLSAGKFTTLSLSTYVWIIRASYSYFMVISSRR